jgi:Major Facilitator Superfamily
VRRQPLGRDFGWLWAGFAVSAAGSGVGAGALPVVAVLVLRASAFQVSALAALSGVASAVIVLPLGPGIEYRRKRPVMIGADLARFAALASVPVAAGFGALTFAQLCAAGVVQAAATIAFGAASGAHLKALVPAAGRMAANARLETTNWVAQTAGPPLGGVLISAAGATVTMAVDAVSFLASALGVAGIRRPEPAPPGRPDARRAGAELIAGWRYIFARRGLRALFVNAMLFGGPVMMASALMAVLMLRDLGLTPLDYGLALGLPCLGGVAGSWAAARLVRRFGQRPVLLTSGAARAPWLLLIPLAPRGPGGLAVIVLAETGLLVAAGVFNPAFSTYRMDATGDAFMARVVSSWSVSSKLVQPLFITAGGTLTAVLGIRLVLVLGGAVCLASALFLPWGHGRAAMPMTAGTAATERAA